MPFAVFYWMLPFVGSLSIAQDYPMYSIQEQMELQYSLVHRSWPLYVHGFAGGRSAAALTLGQMYHPLSHMAAHLPGYWSGYALVWNTLWRLLSLGLTQLVLFNLLRRLRLSADFAFVLSFVTVYNQRMLDMFRYGAALESYTGFLLLCAAMSYLYLLTDRRFSRLGVIGATYLLICGGHPQIAYLGLIGAGLMCLAIPYAVAAVAPEATVTGRSRHHYYAKVVAYAGLGTLLAAAYVVPLYVEFLRDAPSRFKRPYAWSVEYVDHLSGTANNFFNPLRSDVHSAFGSSPLILIAILTPLVLLALRRVKARAFLFLMWLSAVVILLCAIGDNTPVYGWFWKVVPFADSFRVPGRITMLLPAAFMLPLAWFFRSADDDDFRRQMHPIAPWHLVVAALAVFVGGYVLFANGEPGAFTPSRIRPYPWWVNDLILWFGLGSFLAAALRVTRWRGRVLAGALLSAIVIFQAGVQLRHGTWTQPPKLTGTLEEMDHDKTTDLAFRGDAGYGMESSELEKILPDSEELEITRYDMFWPSPPVAAFHQYPAGAGIPVRTLYSSFNRLVLKVEANTPGFLILTAPYSPQWTASVNSHEHEVSCINRGQLAVLLPAGSNQIEFRFHSSASVAGMLISAVTALFITVLFTRHLRPAWMPITIAIVTFVILAGGFALWDHSLYSGDDLGMRFSRASLNAGLPAEAMIRLNRGSGMA